ncbi:DUF5694 domain-containing protein [Hymenobacter radiodurans]|uniref:DUF5694 domain-containing protein n=1 Tax=Hymenobacter radiodurans TaxID=2496028 RepID=UPI001F0DAE49|nr:DUF5694 domain-containing protein [Hymenobacter radiodurans]
MGLLSFVLPLLSAQVQAQDSKKDGTEIMVVGFVHLAGIYNKEPQSDVLNPKKQAEVAKLREHLLKFRPDAIMIEAEPSEQGRIDSLYALYRDGKLDFSTLPEGTGRSERYQVGFVMAKQLNLPSPSCIDYYASTSQSLLNSGDNIDYFNKGLKEMQVTSRPLHRLAQHDSLSVYDYIALANHPDLVAMSHRVVFNNPAMVTNGGFSATGTNTNDLGKVDTAYIGAHYISLFYNRNLKIYSNILRAQQKTQAKRVMVILGQNHVGVQQELFAVNPNYHVVPASTYLKTKATKYLKPKKAATTPAS